MPKVLKSRGKALRVIEAPSGMLNTMGMAVLSVFCEFRSSKLRKTTRARGVGVTQHIPVSETTETLFIPPGRHCPSIKAFDLGNLSRSLLICRSRDKDVRERCY